MAAVIPPLEPVDFPFLFEEECEAIAERRKIRNHDAKPEDVKNTSLGICFSGGGIRSATFNLGVLQGLAAEGLLNLADYLSTVSGGGYIGSWFQGLCSRKAYTRPEAPYADVQDFLSRETTDPKTADMDPITFLRKYSNYLAPQLGALSPDTWVIFTIWLRNTVLNQIIFYLSMCGALLLPLVLGNTARLLSTSNGSFTSWLIFAVVGVLLPLIWAVGRMSLSNLMKLVDREHSPGKKDTSADDDAGVWAKIAIPIFVAALMLSFLIANGRFEPMPGGMASLMPPYTLSTLMAHKTGLFTLAGLLILFACSLNFGGFFMCYRERRTDPSLWKQSALSVVIIVCCALVTFVLLAAVAFVLPKNDGHQMWHCIAWGPPLTILAMASGLSLQVGLMGIDFPDGAREWYSRLAAKMMILCLGWIFLFALVVFAPIVIIWFFEIWKTAGISAGVLWIVTTVAGFQAGKSPGTSGTPTVNSSAPRKTSRVMEFVAKAAPPLAILGMLLAVTTSSFLAIETIKPLRVPPLEQSPVFTSDSLLTSFHSESHNYRALNLDSASTEILFCTAVGLIILALLLSTRVNINEFSMNHFYKNRLVRCYLGASHGEGRSPNAFTGFDPRDDIPLANLVPGKDFDAPYAIVNCTLNLNHGKELAWQERKASSFVFTPRYCGYEPARAGSQHKGYVRTETFTGKGGPHIGLATAISGAAANPNWGYHTSPVTAFLMSIFNVRLGWWTGNTKTPALAHTFGPSVALKYLFSELLGLTDEDSPYLNLSDGGQFENLGIYELIRRQCRFIIVGDGEQDEKYVFESLGGAIRKARIDFGAEIDISPKRVFLTGENSNVHCATGKITYKDGTEGKLLYIKSSLTGDESWDIGQYRKANTDFPQQSTMNQFFTESQFESYRALGRHAVEKIFEKTTRISVHTRLAGLFKELHDNWLPPTSAEPGVFTRHANAYSALLQRLGADDGLRFLDSQLLPNFPVVTVMPTADEMRRAMLLVTDFIQLMEDVYVDLNLEDSGQLAHQQNEGWIMLFRHWKQPGTVLSDVWKRVSCTYGRAFQRFYNRL